MDVLFCAQDILLLVRHKILAAVVQLRDIHNPGSPTIAVAEGLSVYACMNPFHLVLKICLGFASLLDSGILH